MFKQQQNPLAQYEFLCQQQQELVNTISKQIKQFSYARLVLSLVELVFLVLFLSIEHPNFRLVFMGLMVLVIVVFAFLVKRQLALEQKLHYNQKLLWVYQNEINCLNNLGSSYNDGAEFCDDKHAYLSDFDVFGKSSLFALINRSVSRLAKTLLAKHLSAPLPKDLIIERQEAVIELQHKIEETWQFRAMLLEQDTSKIELIKDKLSGKLSKQLAFVNKPLLSLYLRILPGFILLLLFVALVFGASWWSVFAGVLAVNVSINYFFSKQINVVYHSFSGNATLIRQFSKAIAWIEEKDWQSAHLSNLTTQKEKVGEQIMTLSKIIAAFDARLNMLLYTLLNFFFLWDLRCCIRLFRWDKSASKSLIKALDSISYFEELISIATLAHNQPNWCFPTISEQFCLKTKAIGHPLIAAERRVVNDFYFENNPTSDIVTGSNMAGKSTFLRTLGVNMILAYAGAPVCATEMRLSIFHLLSYMRIRDNLMESTSTFKAELDRLKMILETISTRPDCLVLIDEMLRGTNSKDKFDGSKAFIQKMINLGVPMLFATHDLQLADLEQQYPDQLRNFHFDIQIIDDEMRFDYLLKEGPCSQFNAAVLLKQIGLSVAL